jgi:hypothetical protein
MDNGVIDITSKEKKGGLMELPMNGDFNAQKAIEQANKRVDFFKQIKTVSLKMTNDIDWVNESGKPYLQASGAEKLKPIWGIYVKNVLIRPIPVEGKPYPMYECKGVVGSKVTGEESEFIGGRNANDKFFTGKDGTNEVDLMDIMKAAYANFEARAVKQLLGMGNLTWDDLKQGGIDKSNTQTVTYTKGSQGGQVQGDEKTEKKREEIRNMTLDMANGDVEVAKNLLIEFSSWTDKDGKPVKGKDNVKYLTPKQVPMIHKKIKTAYDKQMGGTQ